MENDGRTALHDAVVEEYVRVVKRLLAEPTVDGNATDRERKTPLWYRQIRNLLHVVALYL